MTKPNAGTRNLVATFAAQGNFAAGTGNAAMIIAPAATTVAITPTNAVTYPGNACVTVTVTSQAGTPSGNIGLTLDGVALPLEALTNGAATFTLNAPAARAREGLKRLLRRRVTLQPLRVRVCSS